MSEAGPSTPIPLQSGSFDAVTTSSSVSRSRIHFPADEQNAGPPGLNRHGSSSRTTSLGLGRPPSSRRRSPVQGGVSPTRQDDARRRARSIDVVPTYSGPSLSQRALEFNSRPVQRASTAHRDGRKDKARVRVGGSMDVSGGFPSMSFSNEYDLSHEDPRIVEDVQRALKLKARREARIKAAQPGHPLSEGASKSDAASNSSLSARSSPIRPTLPLPATGISLPTSLESEVDFSPSVGIMPQDLMPQHPIPLSSDGGTTLDWTGSGPEEERRWTLSIHKRKQKEKSSYTLSQAAVDSQESLYEEKLARIRAMAKPNTIHKAKITGDQLQRQYGVLLKPHQLRGPPMNLLSAVRWFNNQEEGIQTSFLMREPLTWLKHLMEKQERRSTICSPWHLTALIMEEYLKSQMRSDAMETIPEDGVYDFEVEFPSSSSPTPASVIYSERKSPSTESWSWTPPRDYLEPSLSRKRGAHEEHAPSDPLVDSGRDSMDRNTGEGRARSPTRDWKQSIVDGPASRRSSLNSSNNGGGGHVVSPSGVRNHIRDITMRLQRKPHHGGEEGLSSARNSWSGQSHDGDAPEKEKAHLHVPTRHRDGLAADQNASVVSQGRPETRSLGSTGDDVPLTAKPQYLSSYVNASGSMSGLERSTGLDETTAARTSTPQTRPRQVAGPSRKRISLPSPRQLIMEQNKRRRQEADQEKERQVFEHKLQLLDDIQSQNRRIRQILQRVGADIREYESVQSGLARLLGIPYTKIPQDVVEAFGHDPSFVTSGTRRLNGWEAVEDIHSRIQRQREILQAFAASISQAQESFAPDSVFDNPVKSVTQALEHLEFRRQHIVEEADDVAEVLARVKDIHSTVKKEYNDTAAYTSLVYPELSQIVALEESYRNQYQQFWGIGLDALTLLLDTVTPFWRTYGTVIGRDVQDFLIIPWYRNEFTGEAKRYPITSFPRRSFRHWVGLLLFWIASFGITMLQTRAAISSTLNYNLPWITHVGIRWMFIPFFSIGLIIQWCAVLLECFILVAEGGLVIWWLGWTIRVFN